MSYRQKMGRHYTPATPEQMERLRAVEAERKKWDPSYIDAEQAQSIPQELADRDPALQQRIRSSAEDWPERHQSAGQVFDGVPGGQGEQTERRPMDVDQVFTGRSMKAQESGE